MSSTIPAIGTIASVVDLPTDVTAVFGKNYLFLDWRDKDFLSRLHTLQPEVLLCAPGTLRLDARMIGALPASIRALATYSVGLDHIDMPAARDHGLVVFNTPDVLADSVADVAMLLMLGAARRATESIALVRGGEWKGWTPRQLNGYELRGRRLGIVGYGGIGQRIATRARAFGMSIAYTNRRRSSSEHEALFVPELTDLAASSDILALACPSTDETRRMIGRDLLRRAKTSLILVNVGRGDLVDDDALIEALAERRIFAAGLDVLDGEPSFDQRYLRLPNTFLLPHIGSSTVEARLAMGEALRDALREWSTKGGRSSTDF